MIPNKVPGEPTLNDLLNLFKTDIFITLNCHAVGTIQAFDSEKQTAQVSINYKKSYTGPTPGSDPVFVDYPALVDCPVVCLGGGTAALTMPIQKGDTCLVLFNDRSLDTWLTTGLVRELPSQRMHSITDGIVIVGLRSYVGALSDYDETRAVLRNANAKVAVGSDLIEISNQVTTLAEVLNGLIDVVKGATTAPIASTPSPGVGLSPTTVAALEAYKSTVEGLLE